MLHMLTTNYLADFAAFGAALLITLGLSAVLTAISGRSKRAAGLAPGRYAVVDGPHGPVLVLAGTGEQAGTFRVLPGQRVTRQEAIDAVMREAQRMQDAA
jgi:hypothetical protein